MGKWPIPQMNQGIRILLEGVGSRVKADQIPECITEGRKGVRTRQSCKPNEEYGV